MKLLYLSLAYLLASLPSTQAVNAVSFPRKQCSGSTLRACINLREKQCCNYPVGGIIASASFFSLLHECTVGIWFYSTRNAPTQCGIARETAAGPRRSICMTGGRPAAGGGAAWLDLTRCRTAAGEVTASEADLAALEEAPSQCTSYQIPTHYALAEDGKGVYVLEPTQEQHDDMNRRPAALSRRDELEFFKYYNATYYEDLSLVPNGEELEGLLVPDDY